MMIRSNKLLLAARFGDVSIFKKYAQCGAILTAPA
jgi:hypothetical protein